MTLTPGAAAAVALAIAGPARYAADADGVSLAGGWQVALPGVSQLAAGDDLVVAAIAGTGDVAGLPGGLRGEPGAALVALGAADGQRRWGLGVGATAWASIRAVAVTGDAVLVAGAFAGTLRIGDRVLTSAGSVDGFWAVVGHDGSVRGAWRMGGPGADAVAGVAALADGRLALAGTYSGAADLGDVALAPLFTDADASDGFVAVIDGAGAVAWARAWGGPTVDACAGVAASTDGLVVAGTVRGPIDVAGRRLDAGTGDGLVAFFDGRGAVRGAVLVGGTDFDGLTAVAAGGGQAVVAGFYAGTITGPGAPLVAAGGDDPLLAVVTPAGVQGYLPVIAAGAAAIRGLTADATGWAALVTGAGSVTVDGRPAAAGTVISRRW
ncbi:MAG: hypothetical protein R3B06_29655 [Kofleriaceae bacterium]